jgi:hypothetical protein
MVEKQREHEADGSAADNRYRRVRFLGRTHAGCLRLAESGGEREGRAASLRRAPGSFLLI